MSAFWRQKEPIFQIDRDFEKDNSPWPCCSVNWYRVRSMRRLTLADLRKLFDVGLLGSGQEFRVHSQCDGKEEHAGKYEVPCVDDKTGCIAKNPVTGLPMPAHHYPYYDYMTSTLCDSSD